MSYRTILSLSLLLFINVSFFAQNVDQTSVSNKYLGIAFSNRTFFDSDMTYIFGNANTIALDIKSLYNYIGIGMGFWLLSEEAPHNIGDFTQIGFFSDALVYIPIDLDFCKFYRFGGGGGVYHFSTMSENLGNFDIAESSGFGYDYVIGSQLDIANVVGAFVQYRGISIIADYLEVGSYGVEFGINLNLQILSK